MCGFPKIRGLLIRPDSEDNSKFGSILRPLVFGNANFRIRMLIQLVFGFILGAMMDMLNERGFAQ